MMFMGAFVKEMAEGPRLCVLAWSDGFEVKLDTKKRGKSELW